HCAEPQRTHLGGPALRACLPVRMQNDRRLPRITIQADARTPVQDYGQHMSPLAGIRKLVGEPSDWLPALLVAAGAQAEVWAGGDVSVRRAADALTLLVITVPLAWR